MNQHLHLRRQTPGKWRHGTPSFTLCTRFRGVFFVFLWALGTGTGSFLHLRQVHTTSFFGRVVCTTWYLKAQSCLRHGDICRGSSFGMHRAQRIGAVAGAGPLWPSRGDSCACVGLVCLRRTPSGDSFFFKLRFCLSGCGLGVSSCFDEVSTGEVVYNRRRSTHTAPTDPTPTEVMKGPTTLAPSPVPVLYPSPVDHR